MNTGKPKLRKTLREMQLRQIQHLRKEMQNIESLGANSHYRMRRLRLQQNMNYKNEYDRLLGELSRSNIPEQTAAIQARHKALKKLLIEKLFTIY